MDKLKITWIGQSGYILSDGMTEICIDPYLSDAVKKINGMSRMVEAPIKAKDIKSDVIICTHNHPDHLDTESILEMNKENICFLSPTDAYDTLKRCGVANYKAFDLGTCITVGNFKLKAVFAYHTVTAIGVIAEHSGTKLYFSGDTLYSEKLEKLKEENIDMSFICINGKLGNMNVADAIKLTQIINPKIAVPSHYGMFSDNTEDPQSYVLNVKNGFEMSLGVQYDVSEVIKNV